MNKKEDKEVEERQTADAAIEEMSKLTNKETSVIIGEDGKEYKLAPCTISQIPRLIKLSNEIDGEKLNEHPDQAADNMAEIIKIGLKKNHPNLKIKFIKDNFTFMNLATVIKEILNLNSFYEMMAGR